MFPLAIAFLLNLSATPAFAANTHALKATCGVFSSPSGIVIDKTNGNVFIADGGSNNSVEIFGPECGAPVGVAVTKIEGFAFDGEPSGLAIDDSATSPSKGALYVTDVKDDSVKKYILNPVSDEYELAGELIATPAFHEPLGVTVDAKGNVFVADFADFGGTSSIVEFDATGTEITHFDVTVYFAHASALAFDSGGNLLVQTFGGEGVWKYAANGSGVIEAGTTPTQITKGNATGLAVDQNTDTLYVASGTRVFQYDGSCTPVEGQCTPELEFGVGVLGSTQRVAVAPNGDIYVVDRGKGNLTIFEAAESVVPDVATKPATGIKQTAATLNGTISAAGGPVASCELQYATKASFESTGFEGATATPCSTGPFNGSAVEPVNAEISGLSPETPYVFRLIGSNENGPNFGEPTTFATVGPSKVKASFIAPLTVTVEGATVEGLINPNGGPNAAVETSYAIEYVSQAAFETSEYAKAISLPTPLSAGGQTIGSGTGDVKIVQQLSGLSPATTYHFRIVAKNEAGITEGPDKTFATFAQVGAGLPDGRSYEQATPVDKGGASAQGLIDFVKAAGGGRAVSFFSNGGIPGSEGAQQFPQYISVRDADGNGWSTRGVLPLASNGGSALVRGFNEDLSQAYMTQRTLPDVGAGTLYQRDSATRALRPIAAGIAPIQIHTSYAGESADGSKVLVELVYDSEPPAGAVKGQNVFVWDKAGGTLIPAGVLNSGQAPVGGTSAGSYNVGGPANYTSYEHPIAGDGSRVLFTSLGSHQVYLRQNPTEPQSSVQGGKCTESLLACTIQISASQRTVAPLKDEKAATLWGTTPSDCRYAFFTSPGRLTNDAPADEGDDLYRYDAETGDVTDLTPILGAEVQGVLGISDDGSHVYFVANGVLAANEGADGSDAAPGDCANSGNPEYIQFTIGECNLYLWEKGTITYIARQQATGSGGGGSEQKSAAWNWVRKPDIQRGEKTARVSTDGGALLFQSPQQLTTYDNEGFAEFYRYTADDGELTCVSCAPSQAAPGGAASLQSIGVVISPGTRPAPVQTRNMSADGKRVFFETPDKLVAADINGDDGCPDVKNGGAASAPSCQDVYEWEAAGAGSCPEGAEGGGCLYLISTGTSPQPSYFADASANGDDAFFFTVQQLVGQDKDEIVDIYDARVGGGIAAQNPPPPPICEGEGCRGPIPPAPLIPAVGSSHFQGPGDPKPCRKGKVRRHGKCVKKSQPQHKKKHPRKHQARRAER